MAPKAGKKDVAPPERAKEAGYETTCPHCGTDFDVAADTSVVACPACAGRMRVTDGRTADGPGPPASPSSVDATVPGRRTGLGLATANVVIQLAGPPLVVALLAYLGIHEFDGYGDPVQAAGSWPPYNPPVFWAWVAVILVGIALALRTRVATRPHWLAIAAAPVAGAGLAFAGVWRQVFLGGTMPAWLFILVVLAVAALAASAFGRSRRRVVQVLQAATLAVMLFVAAGTAWELFVPMR